MAITSILRLSEIKQPAATPLGGSLLDHVSVHRNQEHITARDDDALWRSYREVKTIARAFDPCDDDLGVNFEGYKWAYGTTFALETGTECAVLGNDVEEQRTKMREQFDAYEPTAIEYALEAVFSAKAEDITPAIPGAIDIRFALAALEDAAAYDYPYKPIIHMSRFSASALGDRIVWKDGKAFTRSGIPIAAGGGYGTPGQGTGGWDSPVMYLTGQMFIESGPEYGVDHLIDRRLTAPADPDEGTQTTVITTHRRPYRVGFEGPVLSITGRGID